MSSLSDSVTELHLLNTNAASALNRLGIKTISDLLFYFPRDWQDLSEIRPIAAAQPGQEINIKAQVKDLKERRSRWKRMSILEALLEDESGSIVAIWFNQPYLKNQLNIGKTFYFTGKAQIKETLQLTNPTFELAKEETIHTAGIVPLYDLTEGITQKQLRYWLKQALASTSQLRELLPENILKNHGFPGIIAAIKTIHFPKDHKQLKIARNRLAFEELFISQLAFLAYKKRLRKLPAPAIPKDLEIIKKFISALPFQLTNSQRLAAWEIIKDIEKPYPMNRLLQGDVASGKTVVAGIGMLGVARAGWQAVLLAPTEILALQHYETLRALFHDKLKVGLYTRSHKTCTLSEIATGKVRLLIGTHALLQEQVKFQRIGLLVIDEQQRFGVKQRGKLQATEHGVIPHLLSMTATPIPRTLALAFYGDLDVSELHELPQGRKKIKTQIVADENRASAYEFIKKELTNGRQVYVVTPLIEESDKLGAKAVTTEIEKLKKIFAEFQLATLHGKMRGEEKAQVMANFKKGIIKLLVSTTVIEVGVDVPNASIMIIENAERFGLAQLHQLRGRVGRSKHQSYCFLFYDNRNPETKKRLRALEESNDGFKLAEIDLKLRGAGEIMGTKQSGFVKFKIAKLSDQSLIKTARTNAENLLKKDPNLNSAPLLKQKIAETSKDIHLE